MTNKTTTLRERFHSKFNIAYVRNKGFAFLGQEIIEWCENEIQEAEKRVIDKCVLEEKEIIAIPLEVTYKKDKLLHRAKHFNAGFNAYRAKILKIRKEYDAHIS